MEDDQNLVNTGTFDDTASAAFSFHDPDDDASTFSAGAGLSAEMQVGYSGKEATFDDDDIPKDERTDLFAEERPVDGYPSLQVSNRDRAAHAVDTIETRWLQHKKEQEETRTE